MENIKGILSRRSSQKSSPQRSRAQSMERYMQPLEPEIIINNPPPLDMEEIYSANLFDEEIKNEDKEDIVEQSNLSCVRCNIDHDLGKCLEKISKNKDSVKDVLKLDTLLKSSRDVDGDQVSDILRSLCNKMINSKVSGIQQDINNTLKQVNLVQDKMSKLDNITAYDPFLPYKKYISEVPLPNGLLANDNGHQSLDRLYKLDRMFKQVPTFTNMPDTVHIRDFLHALTSIANTCPESLGFTEQEYKNIVWNKLSPAIQKTLFNSGEVHDAKSLHRSLLTFYDLSETPSEAMTKLQMLKPSPTINTVQKFLNESLRLIDLLDGTQEERAKIFGIAARQFLPERLKRRLEDDFIRHSSMAGKHPSLVYLMNFIKSYKTEIESSNEKLFKKSVSQVQEVGGARELKFDKPPPPVKANGQNGAAKKFCSLCQGKSHTENECWAKTICSRCSKVGHPGSRCRSKCQLCKLEGHGSITCSVYAGQMPMSTPCSICKKIYNVDMFHDEKTCLHRKSKN